MAENVRQRAIGNHPALIDDDDPAGQRLNLGQIVAGDQQRSAAVAVAPQLFPEHFAGFNVQAGGRLIEHHQPRAADQCQRY